MLTGGLVEILDILCHDRGSDGLPCLLDDEALAALSLDTHLLRENVHDDKDDNREEGLVILHLVDLEYDELLVEKALVHVIVEGILQLTATVEGLQNRTEVVDVEVGLLNLVGVRDLRNTLQGKLKEGIEVQLLNREFLLLSL